MCYEFGGLILGEALIFSGFYGILIKSVEGFSFFKTSENIVIRYHLICLIRGPIFYATSHHLHDGVILLL